MVSKATLPAQFAALTEEQVLTVLSIAECLVAICQRSERKFGGPNSKRSARGFIVSSVSVVWARAPCGRVRDTVRFECDNVCACKCVLWGKCA